MAKGESKLSGSHGSGGSDEKYKQIINKINNRPVADVKVKNAISKELKQIAPSAKVSMTTINAGDGITEAENGKLKIITADMGTRYMSYNAENKDMIDTMLSKSFAIFEKYNKEYKFEYRVDKKLYRSDNTNFRDHNGIVYELYGIKKPQ